MPTPEFVPSGTSTRLTIQPWGSQEVRPYTAEETDKWVEYVKEAAERRRPAEEAGDRDIMKLGETLIRGAENGTE